jgi:hypothetical protein
MKMTDQKPYFTPNRNIFLKLTSAKKNVSLCAVHPALWQNAQKKVIPKRLFWPRKMEKFLKFRLFWDIFLRVHIVTVV